MLGISSAPARGTATLGDGILLYTPTGPGPYPYTDSLVYDVADDSGLIVSAKATITVFQLGTDRDSATVTVTVRGVNDAPIITGTRCCFEVYQRGSVQPFAGVTFTEYDDIPQPEPLRLEIIVSDRTRGILTDGTSANLDPDNDGIYVFTGTAAQLTALVRSLYFVPTVGERLVHAPGTTGVVNSSAWAGGTVTSLICGENSHPLAQYASARAYPTVHVSSWPQHFSPELEIGHAIGTVSAGLAYSLKCFVVNAVSTISPEMIEAYGQDEAGEFLRSPVARARASIVGPGGRVIAAANSGLHAAALAALAG